MVIACIGTAAGLVIRSLESAVISANQQAEARKIADRQAKERRVNLKVMCPYLKTVPAAKLSADDRNDLTACRAVEIEDANAEAAEKFAEAKRLQITCDGLRDKALGQLTPGEISVLRGCNALGY